MNAGTTTTATVADPTPTGAVPPTAPVGPTPTPAPEPAGVLLSPTWLQHRLDVLQARQEATEAVVRDLLAVASQLLASVQRTEDHFEAVRAGGLGALMRGRRGSGSDR